MTAAGAPSRGALPCRVENSGRGKEWCGATTGVCGGGRRWKGVRGWVACAGRCTRWRGCYVGVRRITDFSHIVTYGKVPKISDGVGAVSGCGSLLFGLTLSWGWYGEGKRFSFRSWQYGYRLWIGFGSSCVGESGRLMLFRLLLLLLLLPLSCKFARRWGSNEERIRVCRKRSGCCWTLCLRGL